MHDPVPPTGPTLTFAAPSSGESRSRATVTPTDAQRGSLPDLIGCDVRSYPLPLDLNFPLPLPHSLAS